MARKKTKTRNRSRKQLLREISGVLLLVLACVTLLGLAEVTSGVFVNNWTRLWRSTLGWGALAIPLLLGILGVALLQGGLAHPARWPWRRLVSGEVAYLSLLTTLHTLAPSPDSWSLAEAGQGGGLVGWTLSGLLVGVIGWLPTVVVTVATTLVLGGWTLGIKWHDVRHWLGLFHARLQNTRRASPPVEETTAAPPPKPARARPLKIISAAESGRRRRVKRDRRLPPLDLLDQAEPPGISAEEIKQKAAMIEKTLDQFGLPVRVTEVRQGPVVTQFGVEPGYIQRLDANGEPVEQLGSDGKPWRQKVRVGQISALAKDLALALAAPSLRIEAPVPGRSIVGIEVPNEQTSIVHLRPVIESKAFRKVKSPLAVAVGRDVAGAPIAADLSKMPHLLIAGATGSGKSVAMSAMVTCLAFNNPPEQLRLVMIDPKLVEMTRFNGLPHLLGNVEVELERIIGVLRWVTREMDERYKRLSEVGARQLVDYNRQMQRNRQETLPHIVVFVDELADLMTMAAVETEQTITRLAQMARAVGIHLVVATQRPSTDVVTGLIKANFPARISFAVASGVDSRVIIDQVGAEHLLGRGDMLFLNPEQGHPIRIQGCNVSDREIDALVNYWQTETSEEEPQPAPWEPMLEEESKLENERDELLDDAIALCRKEGGASASLLQRRLRIGYPRAAAIIDQMEQLGLVGPPASGGRQREILMDSES
jgi:S-DNA-T family DNA segregation ATPase FtsK/SpoIIIE